MGTSWVAAPPQMADNLQVMTLDTSPMPWLSQEEVDRFSECVTGDAKRDQASFRALLATVSELLGETNLDRLLRKLVDLTIQTTGTERGILMLHDGQDFEIQCARNKDGRNLDPDLPMSRSIPRSVIEKNKPVIARVSSDGEVLDLTRSVASMRLRQVMCAPVRARGKTLGVIYVDSTLAGSPFTAADLMLFHAQAGLMGMAIENNRLFHETLESRTMSQQLGVARVIQQRLLPKEAVKFGRSLLAGVSDAAHTVGGDYFDYFAIDPGRIGLVIGDVSGHGIGPALIMSNVRAHLRSLLQTRRSLAGLYGLLNRALCADLTQGMFVSLFVCAYDRKRGVLEYQNAGHTPPILYDPETDTVRTIPATAPALGIIDEISAGPCPTIAVREGEWVVCYTDGVTERHSRAGELFGEQRVFDAIREVVKEDDPTPTKLVTRLKAVCESHAEGLPPRDDVTIVAARL